MLVVEIEEGDVDSDRLSLAQEASSLYSAALAGFVRWLAPRLDQERSRFRETVIAWRRRSAAHRRTPEVLGQVAAAMDLMLDFALASNAVTTTVAEGYRGRIEQALLELGSAQAEHVRSADPARRFVELLSGVLASGEAHVAAANGGAAHPEHPARWGWQEQVRHDSPGAPVTSWRAQGKRIGWLRGHDLYLEPEAAYSAVQRLAASQGESMGVGPRTLGRRLQSAGLLASTDQSRSTVRRRDLANAQRRVLHLRAEVVFPVEPGPLGPSGPDSPEERVPEALGPVAGPVPSPDAEASVPGSVRGASAEDGAGTGHVTSPVGPEGPNGEPVEPEWLATELADLAVHDELEPSPPPAEASR